MSVHDIDHLVVAIRGEANAQEFREMVIPGEPERNVEDCVVFRLARTSEADARMACECLPKGCIVAFGRESALTDKTRIRLAARFKLP